MKLNELNKYYTFHLTSYIDVGELERDTSNMYADAASFLNSLCRIKN